MRLGRAPLAALLALALCMAAASTSQAAEWKIKGAPLSNLGIKNETLSITDGAFELSVPSLSLTIKCTAGSGSGEIVKGSGTGKASVELTGCVVGKFEKTCSVKSPGKSTGVLAATATTKFFEVEVAKVERAYEELVPTMTVEISGAECSFPTKLEMSGATAAEVPQLEQEGTERVRKFSKAIAEQSGVTSLKLGKNQAFLIGEEKESLSGTHKKEALGMTAVVFPAQMFFAETGVSQALFLENTGPLSVEFTNVEIEAGPYALADAVPCKENVFAEEISCPVTIECATLPSTGKLLVKWEVLSDNLTAVVAGERRATLSCGVG